MKVLHVGQMIGGLGIYIRNTVTYISDEFEFVIVHGEADNSKPVIKDGKAVKEYTISLYRELNPSKLSESYARKSPTSSIAIAQKEVLSGEWPDS